jgi:aminoglycoside phosphotransferase (APT) family kinase protein
VSGWAQRYANAHTHDLADMERAAAWLAEHLPPERGAALIHNDFKLDNLVLDPDDLQRVRAVLDWEMATIGDPLMDLGSALAYWVHADDNLLMRVTRRQPTHLPGMLRREEVVAHYLARTGLRPANWAFYEVFGLFRLAVIVQQIYYRYHHRQTRNPAFRRFWVLVHYFDWRCRSILGRG